MKDDARRAVANGALLGALAGPIAYVGLRLYERAQGAVPAPELMLGETHVGYYWRSLAAAWWGGVAAIACGAYALRKARDVGVASVARRVAFPVALALIVLTYLFP